MDNQLLDEHLNNQSDPSQYDQLSNQQERSVQEKLTDYDLQSEISDIQMKESQLKHDSYHVKWIHKSINNQRNPKYYDCFYGKKGQIFTMMQKYKISLCRHFMKNGYCPLEQHCQFAHGEAELRLPSDPMPSNTPNISLGAVHSNYKTVECKYMARDGYCTYGDTCSYYHDVSDKRALTDKISEIPKGTQLPPMPEKLRKAHREGRYQYNYNQEFNNWVQETNQISNNIVGQQCNAKTKHQQKKALKLAQQPFFSTTYHDKVQLEGGCQITSCHNEFQNQTDQIRNVQNNITQSRNIKQSSVQQSSQSQLQSLATNQYTSTISSDENPQEQEYRPPSQEAQEIIQENGQEDESYD